MTVRHRMDNERGNIGREIESGLDRNNKPWAAFTLVTDVNARNDAGQWEKVGTEMYRVAMFGALARNAVESLRPGDPVVVSGEVRTESRVVDGEAQLRNQVRADMVAPDLVRTAVTMPERSARHAPAPSAAAGPATEAEWGPVAQPGSGAHPAVGA